MKSVVRKTLLFMLCFSFCLFGCNHNSNKTKDEKLTISYKVEHWQQNILNDEYTKFEDEDKAGVAGADTQAEAKTYEGFKSKAFNQEKINANGSTVIKIYYDRNVTSLSIDLAGGATTTVTTDAGNGKVLLKGKYGANVEVATPTKEKFTFVKWTPSLPTVFPAANPTEVYVAEWESMYVKVTVLADERFDVSSPSVMEMLKSEAKTWADIKEKASLKLTLKSEWDKEDYGLYDWKIGSYEGAKLEDNYSISQDITVYARSNYIPFDIKENGTKIYYYKDNHSPKGRIIIPKGITVLGKQCLGYCEELTYVDFSDVNLKEMQKNCLQLNKKLDDINLSSCTELTLLGGFKGCAGLQKIDFSKCKNINAIADGAFSGCVKLTMLDFSQFTNLKSIAGGAFENCPDLVVKLPASITSIQAAAFGDPNWGSQYCKQVIVPNEKVKALVLAVNYPETNIVVQP